MSNRPGPLVLWNVDLTLVDVTRVLRAAFADAFASVTGRPPLRVPRLAGRPESEAFFDAMAVNERESDGDRLLEPFLAEFSRRLSARQAELGRDGRQLPGAAGAVAAVAGVASVQTVLTSGGRAGTRLKLAAFGLDQPLNLELGGYGDDGYPLGTSLQVVRMRVAERTGQRFDETSTVYIGDSARDMAAALAGEARPVAVASGRDTAAELAAAGASTVLAGLEDTEAVLAALS